MIRWSDQAKCSTEHFVITTLLEGLPDPEPTASTAWTTSFPWETFPKTTCLPSSHEVAAVVMKNWLPLVLGPALAIDKAKGSCFSLKFSSANFYPQIDLPPVPSPFVKSPPWIMKLGIIRWKVLPSNLRAFPLCTIFPWQIPTKFYTVLGTVFPKRSITISPAAVPPMSIEKVTWWVIGSYFIKIIYPFKTAQHNCNQSKKDKICLHHIKITNTYKI